MEGGDEKRDLKRFEVAKVLKSFLFFFLNVGQNPRGWSRVLIVAMSR